MSVTLNYCLMPVINHDGGKFSLRMSFANLSTPKPQSIPINAATEQSIATLNVLS